VAQFLIFKNEISFFESEIFTSSFRKKERKHKEKKKEHTFKKYTFIFLQALITSNLHFKNNILQNMCSIIQII